LHNRLFFNAFDILIYSSVYVILPGFVYMGTCLFHFFRGLLALHTDRSLRETTIRDRSNDKKIRALIMEHVASLSTQMDPYKASVMAFADFYTYLTNSAYLTNWGKDPHQYVMSDSLPDWIADAEGREPADRHPDITAVVEEQREDSFTLDYLRLLKGELKTERAATEERRAKEIAFPEEVRMYLVAEAKAQGFDHLLLILDAGVKMNIDLPQQPNTQDTKSRGKAPPPPLRRTVVEQCIDGYIADHPIDHHIIELWLTEEFGNPAADTDKRKQKFYHYRLPSLYTFLESCGADIDRLRSTIASAATAKEMAQIIAEAFSTHYVSANPSQIAQIKESLNDARRAAKAFLTDPHKREEILTERIGKIHQGGQQEARVSTPQLAVLDRTEKEVQRPSRLAGWTVLIEQQMNGYAEPITGQTDVELRASLIDVLTRLNITSTSKPGTIINALGTIVTRARNIEQITPHYNDERRKHKCGRRTRLLYDLKGDERTITVCLYTKKAWEYRGL